MKTDFTYPKVLILSRGFRAGDAITTLNLFSKWPKEKLFGASLAESEYAENLQDFYFIGDKEINYKFLYSLIFTPSRTHIGYKEKPSVYDSGARKSLIRKIYEKVWRPAMLWLDLYEERRDIEISEDLRNWIDDINPDMIYTSVGDRTMAKLLKKIKALYPHIKIIVHCYDEWLSPSYRIWAQKRHYKKSEQIFREILSLSDIRFTATQKMATDYAEKYHLDFTCFTNPVRLVMSENCEKKKSVVPNIVFIGKVGWHNSKAIDSLILAVRELNSEGIKLTVDIFTDTPPDKIRYFLKNEDNNVVFHKPIPNKDIPDLLSMAHLLYLPISIDEKTKLFTKYSMSTKMGEYLGSGTPFIYVGPEGIAMTDFLEDNHYPFVIKTNDIGLLKKHIIKGLKEDHSDMLNRCRQLAEEFFDLGKVSISFVETILNSLRK